ncbi:SulP family inorganic anion transporter [Mycoplana dimorpha]|uniref:MFS superfamily sulfate permease-like transporter n=1 Tax=Mycoplana dimorpha TaxID=28320 RepID=A0A2T5B3K1_MYCDI|nr:SulP family inorganic anion transporter [Mycoplana dimorpha]PTM93542.1 MFS superfamily sulfate permease-like transporter [Mycoplana dimorpha]
MQQARNGQKDAQGPLPLLFASLRGWSGKDLGGDALAGLTLAAIAIPEQMATARLGDLSPQAGFLAFMAGAVAFALFGASRSMSVGADSTIAPIFAAGLVLLAQSGSPHYAALAALLALMVGATVAVAGLLRFGWIADLLSVPVTAGFLAGISVHIVVSQLPALLGLPSASGNVFQRLAAVHSGFGEINLYSAAIGIGVFAVIVVCERISAHIPGALVALAASSLAVVIFGLPGRGVAVLGTLPAAVPGLHLPAVTFDDMRTLVPLTLLVAIVVMVQTAATTRSFASANGSGDDVNRDFVGVGAGNLICGLVGAFPINASPPRTAIVVETGGRSQVASLVAAVIVLALVLFGAGLLKNVPQSALAGVLFFVAMRILRWQTFAATLRQAPTEFLLVAATALAIVALPIEIGVAIGIGLSLLHGVWTITQAGMIEFEHVPGTSIWWPPNGEPAGERVEGVLVVAFQAPLSFVNAGRFGRDFRAMVAARAGSLNHVIFEASSVIDIDYTAAQTLCEVIAYCRDAGITFSIARLESVRAQAALARFGIAAQLGHARVFRSVDEAVRALTGGPGVAASSSSNEKA